MVSTQVFISQLSYSCFNALMINSVNSILQATCIQGPRSKHLSSSLAYKQRLRQLRNVHQNKHSICLQTFLSFAPILTSNASYYRIFKLRAFQSKPMLQTHPIQHIEAIQTLLTLLEHQNCNTPFPIAYKLTHNIIRVN